MPSQASPRNRHRPRNSWCAFIIFPTNVFQAIVGDQAVCVGETADVCQASGTLADTMKTAAPIEQHCWRFKRVGSRSQLYRGRPAIERPPRLAGLLTY